MISWSLWDILYPQKFKPCDERFGNTGKKSKTALKTAKSADIGRYWPAPAGTGRKLKFLLAKYFIWIKKPIRPETGWLQSVNRHFEVKLSDFGSAVERQNDFGDFIKHQSFTRSTFLNSWENLTIIKCPVCRHFLCKITENVRFWGSKTKNRLISFKPKMPHFLLHKSSK